MEETVNERKFDSYCKKILRHEAIDYFRKLKKHQRKEIPFSELPQVVIEQFEARDEYLIEQYTFRIIDEIIVINSELLGESVKKLSGLKRKIVLLSSCLGYSDKKIGEMLRLPRSTIQYQRSVAFSELKRKYEEAKNNED